MTDEMFPGQDRDEYDGYRERPGAAFAGEFGDEPPLIDMVPRALAGYERGRRRRQAVGMGGGVAAVAATVLVTTQLLGGSGTGSDSRAGAGVVEPGSGPYTSAAIGKPTPPPAPRSSGPSAGSASSSAATSQSTATSGSPVSADGTKPNTCDQTFALVDFPGDPVLPIPDAAAASAVCRLGLNTLDQLLPDHTWGPGRVRTDASTLSYVPDSYTADGFHTPGASDTSTVAVDISPTPHFTAGCSKVSYPQTTCRDVALTDGTHGIEVDSPAGAGKPGGYTLYLDLPGGRQFQFSVGYQAGGPQPVTLDGFLTLVKSPGFAEYVKQYKLLMGS